jgi:hypothetical protein
MSELKRCDQPLGMSENLIVTCGKPEGHSGECSPFYNCADRSEVVSATEPIEFEVQHKGKPNRAVDGGARPGPSDKELKKLDAILIARERLNSAITHAIDNSPCSESDVIDVLRGQIEFWEENRK